MIAVVNRVDHKAIMARAFAGHRYPAKRGFAPQYSAAFAELYGDENEAVPDQGVPEPEVGCGRVIRGASVTCQPREVDPTLPVPPIRRLPDPPRRPRAPSIQDLWALPFDAVEEWLEDEPLTADALAALTGASRLDVTHVLWRLRLAGKVERLPDGRWKWVADDTA